MNPRLRHSIQTPTVGLTAIGLTALGLHIIHDVDDADLIAFVALGLVSGGVAMALGAEVERHGEEWGWRGLARSLRRPSRIFWIHLFAHLPQLLIVSAIALHWRRRSKVPRK